MNKLFLIQVVAALSLPAAAQTNSTGSDTNGALAPMNLRVETGATQATNAAPPAEIDITADKGEVNLETRVAIHRGNVKVSVTDPRMTLTCELLTTPFPKEGEKPDHILAEGNVVIDHIDQEGRTTHAKGDKALYTYRVTGSVTNETIELSGNAYLTRDGGSLTGDPVEPITWDLINNRVHYTKSRVVIPMKSSATNAPARTETPPGP